MDPSRWVHPMGKLSDRFGDAAGDAGRRTDAEAIGSPGDTPEGAKLDSNDHAQRWAMEIAVAYERYRHQFDEVTRRARGRFEARQFRELQADARERLDVYQRSLDEVVARLKLALGGSSRDRALWKLIKRRYCALVGERDDSELAETFYNSVTRRIFTTVGVDPEVEFVDWEYQPVAHHRGPPIYREYPRQRSLSALVEQILARTGFRFQDPAGEAQRVAFELERQLAERRAANFEEIQVLDSIFFRNQLAFLVGRIWTEDEAIGLLICLAHPPDSGVVADAVLTDRQAISGVFSLSRNYFHADTPCVRATVSFLLTLMPHKSGAELYTTLGHKRHGKTETYRNLIQHLSRSAETLRLARGERGLVMLVFTLPSLDLVFKVIRDRPSYPKSTTRAEVMEHYKMVFQRDRVGRMVDFQEFEHLRLDRSRFSDELINQLREAAAGTVEVDEDAVVLHHLYSERRVVPLDLYVRERDEKAVMAALLDFGDAIKELAASNVFPGDVLLKNFGVKQDGRVVFYDYDELCLLSEVNFRQLPPPSDFEDEMAGEPWFYVGPNDVFPEELERFLGIAEPYRERFRAVHGDLFKVEFWHAMQQRHAAGELIPLFPYTRHLQRG